MRLFVIALAAGAAAFLVFRVLMDAAVFAIAPRAEFLRPPAAGFGPEAALQYANWATASYWIAAVVALIVLIVAPLVRWSAAWPGPEAGPPLAPDAGAGDGRRPLELWPDRESDKRWAPAPPPRPATAPSRLAPAAQPAAETGAAPADARDAIWTPPVNSYAQAVKRRYGPARLRPSRKAAEPQPQSQTRSQAKPKRGAGPARAGGKA